jgi:UDP-N-acetylglucosamine:LPS N-acetylglucosamine transferase
LVYGRFAPTPEEVVATLHSWLESSAELKRMAANAFHLARPDASRRIARRLVEIVNG